MNLEDKLEERGIRPDTCEAKEDKLVCETEDGGKIEITREDVEGMMEE